MVYRRIRRKRKRHSDEKLPSSARVQQRRETSPYDYREMPTTAEQIQQLQREMGNQYVVNLLQTGQHTSPASSSFLQRFVTKSDSGSTAIQREGDDEWKVTPDKWKTGEALTGDKAKDQKAQFDADAAIMYQTMFSEDADNVKGLLSPEQMEKQKQKQDLMKRILLSQAVGGVKYSTKDNPAQGTDNELQNGLNMPMASLLSHGQRHIFDAGRAGKDTTNIQSFFSFLLSGNADTTAFDNKETHGGILNSRAGASHGIDRDKAGNIREYKRGAPEDAMFGTRTIRSLYNQSQLGSNMMDQGKHYGVDLAFGGLGSQEVNGNYIGKSGRAMKPAGGSLGTGQTKFEQAKNHKGKDIQHGHLYINDNGLHNAMMLGIESSPPTATGSKASMFGVSHTADSGTIDQTKNRSVTGGQKMKPLMGDQAPAEYGGKQTQITPENFAQIQEVNRMVATLDEDAQKKFFKTILKMTPDQAQEYALSLLEAEKREKMARAGFHVGM